MLENGEERESDVLTHREKSAIKKSEVRRL